MTAAAAVVAAVVAAAAAATRGCLRLPRSVELKNKKNRKI